MKIFKGKAKYSIVMILLLAMLSQTLIPSILNMSFAEEADEIERDLENEVEQLETEKPQNLGESPRTDKGAKDLGNIFTFESMTIDNTPINDGDVIEIGEDTIVEIKFKWDTKGKNAKAGDTAEIALSDAFKMITTPYQDITVEGANVGTYHVENGFLIFEFNEGIEQSDVQNGFVNLGFEFNLKKFKEDIEQEIPFHDGSNHNITVIAKPNITTSVIDKEGDPDSQENAKEITWTIDVINTNEEEIAGATLADNIPDGLGQARDFVIHELSLDYGGNKIKGADVTSNLNPSDFPINLGKIGPFKGYRVQYTTTIENYALKSFTNEAEFSYGDTSLPAEATVEGLTRSNPIEKYGEQIINAEGKKTDEIQWQIDVNKNGSLISEAIVYDILPEGLEAPDNIQVVRITQNGDNWEPGNYHEKTFTGFPINLGALGEDDAYRIYFTTEIDWAEVNSGEYLKDNGFENVAILYDGENELNDADAIVPIQRDPILEKVEVGNVDYENRTITWEVTVNKAKHPLGDVTVTDILPKGLSIDAKDIEITGDNGTDFSGVNPSIDTINDGENDEKTKLTINLTDVGTETITIKYTTSITDFNLDQFTNTVGMEGVGVGKGGEGRKATIKPNANTYTKSFAGIDYNDKTINWRLNVNPVREDIKSGFVITDTFTNDGLILLPATVNITLGGTPLAAETDYTVAPIGYGYQNGFTITFHREIAKGELVVNFATSYDPQKEVEGQFLIPHSNEEEKELYRNKAEFDGETMNGNKIDKKDDASQRVRTDSWNSGKKEGQLVHLDGDGNPAKGWVSGSERKIAWQLYMNYQKQNLGTGVVVTDTLAYEGEIDKDSIKVFVYNVGPSGKTTITDTVLDSEKYSVNIDEDGKLTLTFAEGFEVKERYVIKFTTSVPDISAGIYTNNANVKVGEVDYPYEGTVKYKEHNNFLKKGAVGVDNNKVFTGDEVDWEVTVNESLSIINNAVITDTISEGHAYVADSFRVYKSQDLDKALVEGTDYTLEDSSSVLKITLSKPLKDTLVLKYTTVVTTIEGDISNSISLEGTSLDKKTIVSEKLSARQFSSVGGEWAKNKGALRVTKVDAETKEVINNNQATFELWYDLNGERVQYTQVDIDGNVIPFITENGVLEIGNLPLRTYYLKEVAAPEGYVLAEQEIEIVVDKQVGNDKENPVVTVETFKNTKEKIEVKATKVWEGGPKPAIELQLYRDGEPYLEPVTLNGTEDEPWAYTWTNLDKTDIDGNEYKYSIDEVNVPENYEKEVSEDSLTVTNTYAIPKTEVTGAKEWKGGPSTKPTIELQLYRQIKGMEKEIVGDSVELNGTEDEPWTYTWTNLDKTDIDGKEYKYTIDEVKVPKSYRKSISEDGLTVINTYVDPTEPTDPDKPDPNEPVEPTDPDKPDPNEPVEPTDPDKPDPNEPVEPTDPDKPDPNEPVEPTDPDKPDPNKPNKPTNPSEPGNPDKPKPDDPKGEEVGLPKTGYSTNLIIPILGLLLVMVGFVLRRKVN